MKFRSLKQALLAAGVLALGQSALATEVDYTGYFRAQAAHNSEEGQQACFKLAGAQSKYRLGNECDNYGELTLNNVIAKSDDGAVFSGHVMLSEFNNSISNASLAPGAGSAGTASVPNTPTSGQIGIPQVFIQGDKIPEIGGASAWIGRKYYKREDVHITDFFYWNPSGMGAGIENLAVGGDGMMFSYALFRDDDVVNQFTAAETGNSVGQYNQNGTALGGGNSATRHDFQLRGIKTNPDGSLELGLTLVQSDSKAPNTKSGVGVTIQHRQGAVFGGENKLAFQYMTDSAVANGGTGALQPTDGYKRVRLVEELYFQPTPTLGGQVIGVYQDDTDNGNGTATSPTAALRWTSLGGRLAIGITPHFKIDMDLGYDTVQPKGGQSANLMKFTIAPALAIGPAYYGRPELRLFYTYAKWNDAARFNANGGVASPSCTGVVQADPISSCGVFGAKDNGSTIGFQAEAWW